MSSAIKLAPTASFFVARLGERTWTVAYARRVIPGAILGTRDAALAYVRALALGAGLSGVSVSIAGRPHEPTGRPRVGRRVSGR